MRNTQNTSHLCCFNLSKTSVVATSVSGRLFKDCLLFLLLPILLLLSFHSNIAAQVVEKEKETVTIAAESTKDTSVSKPKSIFNTWQGSEVPKWHLTTNMKLMVKEKDKEAKQVALLKYQDKDGQEKTDMVQIRARGNMRKNICAFPPIKLYYEKDYLDSIGLDRACNDYKLVTSCQAQSIYQDYVLKEYLLYKLYNVVTEFSYQVQLVHLTIEDSENKSKPIESYSFIIENDEEMAARLSGKLIEPKILSPRAIIPEHYDRMALFQYMIGNTDWYMYNKHNMKILKNETASYPIIIPYDFDYAGIINAHYAVPHEKLPIKQVKERFFLGMCRTDSAYEPTLQLFRDKKEEILATCENFPLLDAKEKERMVKYLTEFFDIINDTKKTQRNIIEHCDQHIKIE